MGAHTETGGCHGWDRGAGKLWGRGERRSHPAAAPAALLVSAVTQGSQVLVRGPRCFLGSGSSNWTRRSRAGHEGWGSRNRIYLGLSSAFKAFVRPTLSLTTAPRMRGSQVPRVRCRLRHSNVTALPSKRPELTKQLVLRGWALWVRDRRHRGARGACSAALGRPARQPGTAVGLPSQTAFLRAVASGLRRSEKAYGGVLCPQNASLASLPAPAGLLPGRRCQRGCSLDFLACLGGSSVSGINCFLNDCRRPPHPPSVSCRAL